MICSNCQSEISDNVKFCPQCGFDLSENTDLVKGCLKDINKCEDLICQGHGSKAYIQEKVNSHLSDWKKCADDGLKEAQWLLGRCYDEGLGVQMDKAEAFAWHLKAARQGFARSQSHIALCYQDGEGVQKDEHQAVEWFRKAADQGLASAQSNLGWRYDAGIGVAKDEAEGFKWHLKAAEQGDYTAQYNVGVHYEWGGGIEQDNGKAIKWYQKAAGQGYEKAVEALNRLGEQVSSERINQSPQTEGQAVSPTEDVEQQFRDACKEALTDGKLAVDEKHELKTMAKSLGISKEDMKSLFNDEKKIFKEARSESKSAQESPEQLFRNACKRALADGKLTVDERQELKDMAKSLGMSKEAMKQLFEDEKRIFLESRSKK